MKQILMALLSAMGTGLTGMARWVAGNLKYAVGLVALVIVLLAVWRLFLPLSIWGTVRETLENRGGYSAPVAGFFGMVAAAIVIPTTGALAMWILLGRRPEFAALGLMAIAVVLFLPAMSPFVANFDRNGNAQRWYSEDQETGLIVLHDTDRSRDTGEAYSALTQEVAVKYQLQDRRAPRVIGSPSCELQYFDAATGRPRVFMSLGNHVVRLFDGPGHDPWSAERLRPVTPELVSHWMSSC